MRPDAEDPVTHNRGREGDCRIFPGNMAGNRMARGGRAALFGMKLTVWQLALVVRATGRDIIPLCQEAGGYNF